MLTMEPGSRQPRHRITGLGSERRFHAKAQSKTQSRKEEFLASSRLGFAPVRENKLVDRYVWRGGSRPAHCRETNTGPRKLHLNRHISGARQRRG